MTNGLIKTIHPKKLNPNYTFKSETDRVFSVFDSFKQDAENTQLSLGNQEIGDRSKFLKSWSDALYVTCVTQEIWAMLKCLFIYIPKQRLEIWSIRVNLDYEVQGMVGVLKSFLYTLGWHSAWKTPPKSS